MNLNIKFLLVGGGYQKKKIEEKIRNSDSMKKFIFLFDYFPKNEMPKILSAATIISSFFIDLPDMENNSANKFFDGTTT